MEKKGEFSKLAPFSHEHQPLKIIYVEDHEVTRLGTIHNLKLLAPRVEVIEVPRYQKLIDLSADNQDADLLVLDLDLPDVLGVVPVSDVLSLFPEVPIVVFSAMEDMDIIRASMQQGVVGFVLKKSPAKVIINALQLILDGETFFPKGMFSQVSPASRAFEESSTSRRLPEPSVRFDASGRQKYSHFDCSSFRDRLTPRQIDVLKLIASGYSNKEIARALNISPGTTKNHVAEVLRILGISNRREAICKVLTGIPP